MALNRVREEATRIKVAVPDGTESGDPLIVGEALACVAVTDENAEGDDNDLASVQTNGSFSLLVAGPVSVGEIIYFHSGTPNVLNGTASGGTRFGYALEAIADSSDVEIEVKIGY